MHFSLSFLTISFTGCIATTIQVNYYYDGGCTDLAVAVHPWVNKGSDPHPDCYDYAWTGANSANVANCSGNDYCECTLWTQPGCQGASETVSWADSNCASNWGHGFVSMTCV